MNIKEKHSLFKLEDVLPFGIEACLHLKRQIKDEVRTPSIKERRLSATESSILCAYFIYQTSSIFALPYLALYLKNKL